MPSRLAPPTNQSTGTPLVLVGPDPRGLRAWWMDRIQPHWPGDAPRFVAQPLSHGPTASDSVVILRLTAPDDAQAMLQAAAALTEANTAVVALVPVTFESVSRRLAALGVLVLDSVLEPPVIAQVVRAVVHQRAAAGETARELALAHRAQSGAKEWIRRIDDELHLAACVQREILPRTFPRVAGFEFDALYRPLWHVSGDVYRVNRLDEHRTGFFLADAMGHGLAAAMLTMILAHALPTKEMIADTYRIVGPAEALARLNAEMLRFAPSGVAARFASAVYGIADSSNGTVRLAVAGHPPPVHLEGRGGAQSIDLGGPVLGVFEQAAFPEVAVRLGEGGTLVVFTDGAEEVLGAIPKGAKPPAIHWSDEWFGRGAAEPLAVSIARLTAHMDALPGSLHRTDDATVLAIRATR